MPKHEWSDLLNAGDSVDQANDYFYNHHLTDGLPIIPPTVSLVERAIEYSGYDPDHVVAAIPPLWADATIAKIAANAVMAGCEPKHLPVVIAALECVTAPEWDLFAKQATTNPGGPFLLVNGPCRDAMGINYGFGCFGPGSRANATIGRAVRLIMMNIGGSRPGELDLATHGFPGKFTMCIGENEEENPWEPYHVEHGFAPEANTVTASFIYSIINVFDGDSLSVKGLMTTLVNSLKIQGMNNFQHGGIGQIIVMFNPEWAQALADRGETKQSIRQHIWDNAVMPISSFSELVAERIVNKRTTLTDGIVRVAKTINDIIIVVSGGRGRHTLVLWGNKEPAQTTREIKFGKNQILP